MTQSRLLVLVISDSDPLRADLVLRAFLAHNVGQVVHVGMVCVGDDDVRATAHRMIEADYPGLPLHRADELVAGLAAALGHAEQVLILRDTALSMSASSLAVIGELLRPGQWACLDKDPKTCGAVMVLGPTLHSALSAAPEDSDLEAVLSTLTRVILDDALRGFERVDVVSESWQTLSSELCTALFVAGQRGLLPDATSLFGGTALTKVGEVHKWPLLPIVVAQG